MIPASEYLVKVSLCVVKPSEQLIAFNFFFIFKGLVIIQYNCVWSGAVYFK